MGRADAATNGVILAGGAARRLGGADKSLMRVGGTPILGRIVATLGPQCTALVLNANGDPRRFFAFGLPVVADDVPGLPGPMAGILAGLEWSAAHAPAVDWVLSVPGDAPFLPSNLVAKLQEGRETASADVAYAASADRIHPTVALWPTWARGRLRKALVDDGIRRVTQFLDLFDAVAVHWRVEEVDPFANINTPQDLAAAETIERLRG